MRSTTRETIALLENIDWYGAYGDAIAQRVDWVAASTISEAKESALSDQWLSFRLMVSNRMHRQASQTNYDRFSKWNAVAVEIQQAVTPLVERVVRIWVDVRGPSKKERISVAWDIQGICMEAEFSDLLSPLFFQPRLLDCYESGHMPCGWLGPMVDERWAGASSEPLPEGKLLVF